MNLDSCVFPDSLNLSMKDIKIASVCNDTIFNVSLFL